MKDVSFWVLLGIVAIIFVLGGVIYRSTNKIPIKEPVKIEQVTPKCECDGVSPKIRKYFEELEK